MTIFQKYPMIFFFLVKKYSKVFIKGVLEMQNQKGKLKTLDELLEVAEIQTSYNKPKQLTLFDFSK